MLSMNDNMLSVGIDISKDKVDIAVYNGNSYVTGVFDNSVNGVNRMLAFVLKNINIKSLERTSSTSNRNGTSKQKGSRSTKVCFVMEATGTYYLTYANTLYDKGYTVYVINPLIIKRYGEEKLRRAKTDKADAKLISEFGYYNIMSRAVRSRTIKPVKSIEDRKSGTNNSNTSPLDKYLFKPNSSTSIKVKLMLKTIDQLYIYIKEQE